MQVPDGHARRIRTSPPHEIELPWVVVDPYIEAWETELAAQLYACERGTWGPNAADQFDRF